MRQRRQSRLEARTASPREAGDAGVPAPKSGIVVLSHSRAHSPSGESGSLTASGEATRLYLAVLGVAGGVRGE